jgi:hypothetical protein
MAINNCGTSGSCELNGVSLPDTAKNCMYINGSGDDATEVRGWAEDVGWGYPVHEQVVMPNGNTYCKSGTISTTGSSAIISCQGGPENILVGEWCSIVWVYANLGDGTEYYNMAETCGIE